MHNCELSRRNFINLALDEVPTARTTQLLAELNGCAACQAEYATLRSTLHVSNQALRSTLPAEEFWPAYRTRLHAKLLARTAQQIESEHYVFSAPSAGASLSSRLLLALRTMATASVRLPVPAAFALLLLFGVSIFVVRAREQVITTQSTPVAVVETRTVEVPVIQEKVVTRVVYVEKQGHRSPNGLERTGTPGVDNLATTGLNPPAGSALSLVGFKPTDQVKLTIIKGSYKDDKR
jgi:anti-sigma factor RsiW